jgi:serine/threonine-protein kinase
MAAIAADRDLLFGLLALQVGLIDQDQLVAAFRAWTRDRVRTLADHLADRGDLDSDQRAGVEAMVGLHLKKHGGDAEKSLAALPAAPSIRASLSALGDADFGGTLTRVGSGADGDADRTSTYSVGSATSDGQRFRILRPHARGGLGAVFAALDTELHREVALKQILEKHAGDPTSRRRFVLEAEVTGGLEHPGIVPVYGLGTDADGRPYYAMRFIRGGTLKEAVDRFHADLALKGDAGRRSLELRRLLRRFVDVCNALEYAHSRGVLHRDIKPANVIVGKHGETLFVDWGLAKATGRSDPEKGAGEKTLVPSASSGSAETLPGSALGTPAYMSPEQAEGNLEHLGRRSDVYSLGATLYYLLSGRPPAEGEIGEVLRAVQRGEIVPPLRHDPTIDRALEAVCLKAMAPKPADRYATAKALAEDVERWMADEPVTAWREPWTRTTVRWLTRHRTGVTAAGAAVLVALAGTAAVLAVQTQANAALKTANQEVTRANADLRAANARERERFELALEAVKLFHGEVSEDLLLKEKSFAGLRSRLLKGAADFYGKLERRLAAQSDPSSRAALGRAYHDLAELTREIGDVAEALDVHRKALDVRRELAGRTGSDDAAMLDVVRSLYAVAVCQDSSGDTAARRMSWEEALRLADGLVAAGRGGDEARFELARCATMLSLDIANGRPDEGLAMARRAETILRELVAKAPSETRYLEGLGDCLWTLGFLHNDRGRQSEALAVEEEAAATYQKLIDGRPEVNRFRNILAILHNNIAETYSGLGQPDAAMASQRRAVAIWREAAAANPAVTGTANNLAYGLDNLADYLIDAGRPVEALLPLAESRPILKKLVDANLGSPGYRLNLAGIGVRTGRALARMGMSREADEAYAEAGATLQTFAEEHRGWRASLGRAFRNLGWALWTDGRPAEAAAVFERERAIRQRMAAGAGAEAADPGALATCETTSAAAFVALGRPAEARAACDRAIAIREGQIKEHPADASVAQGLAESQLRSGHVRAAAGDLVGAAAAWRRAAALYAAHPPVGEAAILRACCHGALAGLAGKQGGGVAPAEARSQADEAMAVLRRAIDGGYRDFGLIRVEPGIDPLRSRDDFRRLMGDLAFPADPFAYRVDAEYRPVPDPLITTAPAGK